MYEDNDDVQQLYAENVFVGVGRGRSRAEAEETAYENAWQRAKGAGKAGKPLRVDGMWVAGENPITWCRVVLVDDNP